MKKKAKCTMIILLTFCMLVIPSLSVSAKSGEATLTVSCHGKSEDETLQYLKGLEITLFYVASAGSGGSISQDFVGSGLDLGNLENLSVTEQKSLAIAAANYVTQNQIDGERAETDDSGKAVFTDLEYGLYLVIPQEIYYLEKGSFVSVPFFVSVPNKGSENVTVAPKTQWVDGILIGLENLTVYTGGNETVDKEPDGFPRPRYKGIPDQLIWYVDGEEWNEEGYPFQVYYTYAKDTYGAKDSGVIAPNDEYPGVYIAHIKSKKENATVTCVGEDGKERKVLFQDALLIVRNVDKNQREEQIGDIVSIAGTSGVDFSEQQLQYLEKGLGVVKISDDAVLTVNDNAKLGMETLNNTGLLFDSLLFYGTNQAQYGAEVLLKRTADKLEKNENNEKKRQYQGRYLDLVSYTDGNLWLSSNLGCEVYWPYPDGTDKNTKFDLIHFDGLFREYGIMGNPELETLVQTAELEQVAIENTEYGIRFFVPKNGFGPFILSWYDSQSTSSDQEDNNENISSDQEGDNEKKSSDQKSDSAKTGDNNKILIYVMLFTMSCLMAFFVVRRRIKYHKKE